MRNVNISARNRTGRQLGGVRFAVVVIAASGPLLAGCGNGGDLELAPVEGIVTFEGRPLDHGQVVFMPDKGVAGPPAMGTIDSNGEFVMQTAGRVGAVIGSHRVTVHCRTPHKSGEEKSMVIKPSLIPEKYWKQDLSPLRFDVKDENNRYDIVLD
jgi:hypothetical protein